MARTSWRSSWTGKAFADALMVVALGVTLSGDKRFLGFVETDTENEQVLTPFLRSLMERGLDISEGVLVIVDGGKGLRGGGQEGIQESSPGPTLQWHKRENVVRYLSKTEQAVWRRRLQRAYERPEYDEARAALGELHGELEERNQSGLRALRKAWKRPSRCIGSACTGSWAVRSRRRIAWNRSMPLSRKGVRRSIIGRTRVSGNAGWRRRSSTSNRA